MKDFAIATLTVAIGVTVGMILANKVSAMIG